MSDKIETDFTTHILVKGVASSCGILILFCRIHFEDLASSNDAQGPENSVILLTEEMPADKISMQQYVLIIKTYKKFVFFRPTSILLGMKNGYVSSPCSLRKIL